MDGNVTGLFYGDAGQFFAQCIGGLANFVGVGLLTLAASIGLDIPEMGVLAYPEGVSRGDPSAPLPATVMSVGSRAAA